MGEGPCAVVDANVLLNLATPVVDALSVAPTGGDPFRAVVTAYDVHVPDRVLGEVSAAVGHGDLLAAAAELVLRASHHLTTQTVDEDERSIDYGLDPGETRAIALANDLGADLFVTDEFGATNYLLVSLALADRNTLFTTPHVLCRLAEQDVLDPGYVDAALTYYVDTKDWDREYVACLRRLYL